LNLWKYTQKPQKTQQFWGQNCNTEKRSLSVDNIETKTLNKSKRSQSSNDKENNQKTPVKADRPPKQVGALVSEMPIEVPNNINTMLKEVSINKKKIKDKNALASNDSVIV
jgi:hypothetical protein